jgi:hypothetical protein
MTYGAVIAGKAGRVATSGNADEDSGITRITVDLSARRTAVMERHHTGSEELEAGLTDGFISGTSDIHGLLAMLKYLNGDDGRRRAVSFVRSLVEDPRCQEMSVRTALVVQSRLLSETCGGDAEIVKAHLVGVYRQIGGRIAGHQGEAPLLGDLRALPMTVLARLFRTTPLEFGSPALAGNLVYTQSFAARGLRTFQRISHPAGVDAVWMDATGARPLRRALEEPLAILPEGVRRAARQLLVSHGIRSGFYRDVFLHYLAPGRIDVEKESYATVLHWLEDIEGTAHLFPFMQGQTAGQKAWRLAQLTLKIVRLHEMYARVALAGQHPAYRGSFPGKSIRERLAMLGKDHYPPLALTRELILAALLCPFGIFVQWVREKARASEFVLPPDPMC